MLPSRKIAAAVASMVAQPPAVVLIDPDGPVNRNQTTISVQGFLQYPSALGVEPGGTLVVRDGTRLIRVDPAQPAAANQTQIAAGLSDVLTSALAVKADGTIVLADQSATLTAVDPTTGVHTPIDDSNVCPTSVAVASDGALIFNGTFPCAEPAVFRLAGGVRTTIAAGLPLVYPVAVAVEADGRIPGLRNRARGRDRRLRPRARGPRHRSADAAVDRGAPRLFDRHSDDAQEVTPEGGHVLILVQITYHVTPR